MIKDNFFGACPGKTYSGAIFTDWRSPDYREHNIIYINDINGDNHEYRHFLQKNAYQLMRNNLEDLEKKSRCQLYACKFNEKDGKYEDRKIGEPKDGCARTILGYGFPVIHTYPTRQDPRDFRAESEKYNKFVAKYMNTK